MLQVQLTKEKQAQIGLDKRLTTTEDAHKAAKANLASANQNMQEMVGSYHEKLRQMKEESSSSRQNESKSVLDTCQQSEKKSRI
jgi:hypothetical protein